MDLQLWYEKPLSDFLYDDCMSIPYMFDSGIYEPYGKYDSVSWCINCLDFLIRVIKTGLCTFDQPDTSLYETLFDFIKYANERIESADTVFQRIKFRPFHGWELIQILETEKLSLIIKRHITTNTEGDIEHINDGFMKAISEEFHKFGVGFDCEHFLSFKDGKLFLKKEFYNIVIS